MCTTLIHLGKDEEAEIIAFEGGRSMNQRLEGMGIRQGKIISRINSQFMKGPVIVSVDGHQAAMGRGMAEKILVKKAGFNNKTNGH